MDEYCTFNNQDRAGASPSTLEKKTMRLQLRTVPSWTTLLARIYSLDDSAHIWSYDFRKTTHLKILDVQMQDGAVEAGNVLEGRAQRRPNEIMVVACC